MNLLWKISSLFLEQCQQFVVWASVIKHLMVNASESMYLRHLERVFQVIINIIQLLCSEGYCYYLDFVSIAYYNPTNHRHVFPPIIKTNIDDLSECNALDITGLPGSQIK